MCIRLYNFLYLHVISYTFLYQMTHVVGGVYTMTAFNYNYYRSNALNQTQLAAIRRCPSVIDPLHKKNMLFFENYVRWTKCVSNSIFKRTASHLDSFCSYNNMQWKFLMTFLGRTYVKSVFPRHFFFPVRLNKKGPGYDAIGSPWKYWVYGLLY